MRTIVRIVILGSLLSACAGQSKAVFNPDQLEPNLQSVMVQNVPIVYSDQGQGDPLVILSPYPLPTHVWGELVGLLSTSMRVIVVEPPGLREPAAMRGDYSTEHLLQIYRDFLRALTVYTAHILGVGETGGTAAAFAHHFPDRTASVISISGFEAVTWQRDFQQALDLFNMPTAAGISALLRAGSVKFQQHPPSPDEVRKLLKFERDEQMLAIQARSTAFVNDLKAGYIPAMLPNVHAPVLIIRGAHDLVLPEKFTVEARKYTREGDVQYAVLPNAGHLAFIDQPQELALIVRNFVLANPIPKSAPIAQPEHELGLPTQVPHQLPSPPVPTMPPGTPPPAPVPPATPTEPTLPPPAVPTPPAIQDESLAPEPPAAAPPVGESPGNTPVPDSSVPQAPGTTPIPDGAPPVPPLGTPAPEAEPPSAGDAPAAPETPSPPPIAPGEPSTPSVPPAGETPPTPRDDQPPAPQRGPEPSGGEPGLPPAPTLLDSAPSPGEIRPEASLATP